MKVTCPKCGSDQITHGARYIVRNRVLRWDHDEHGEWSPVEFGDDEVLGDSCEGVDYPYDCLDCGETEMTEIDLLYDGKNHEDWVGDDVGG